MEEKKCTKCNSSEIKKLFTLSFAIGVYVMACTLKSTIDLIEYIIHLF